MPTPYFDLETWVKLGESMSTHDQYSRYLQLPAHERIDLCRQAHVISFTTVDKIQTVLKKLCSSVQISAIEHRVGRARKLSLHDLRVKKLLPNIGDQFLYFTATDINDDQSRSLQSLTNLYNTAERDGIVQSGTCEEENTALVQILGASVFSRRSIDLLRIEGLRKLSPFHSLTLEQYNAHDIWEHYEQHYPVA